MKMVVQKYQGMRHHAILGLWKRDAKGRSRPWIHGHRGKKLPLPSWSEGPHKGNAREGSKEVDDGIRTSMAFFSGLASFFKFSETKNHITVWTNPHSGNTKMRNVDGFLLAFIGNIYYPLTFFIKKIFDVKFLLAIWTKPHVLSIITVKIKVWWRMSNSVSFSYDFLFTILNTHQSKTMIFFTILRWSPANCSNTLLPFHTRPRRYRV